MECLVYSPGNSDEIVPLERSQRFVAQDSYGVIRMRNLAKEALDKGPSLPRLLELQVVSNRA